MSKICEYIKKYDILILIVFGIVLYFPAFFYDILSYDDLPYIVNNQYLNGSLPIKFFDFFIPNFIIDDIYSPILFILYWSIIHIFGINAFAFHFVNIFFYVLSAVALFYLLRKIINNYSVVFFAVILYILHPCHVECTAWISIMGYNIAVFFFYLSFLCFIIAFDEDNKLNYLYSVVFYVFAILSQPIAVTLPAILVLWLYFFRRERLKESIKYICGYIPFLLIYLYLYSHTILKTDRFDIVNYNYFEKLSILGYNILNSFIPINLSVAPLFPNSFSIIYVFILIFLIIYFRKNNNYLFFILFGIISILPYSNIFFNIAIAFADRYLLLSSVSSCVLISYLSFYIFDKFKEQKIIKYLGFVFFIVFYLFSFLLYFPVWKNDEKFINYTYNSNPDHVVSLVCYSNFLVSHNRYDEAIIVVDKLIEKFPSVYEGYDLKFRILVEQKFYDKALDFCKKIKENNPEYYKAYLFMSDIYMLLRDYDKSNEYLSMAEEKCKKYNLFKGENLFLFANKKMLLSFFTSDLKSFIENLKIVSNDFKLFGDDSEFFKILDTTDYKSREEICLNYLKKHKSQYSNYIFMLLSCLYMEDNYKDNASKVMRSILKDIRNAQENINKGDNISAEKIYLSVISKNKYIYEAYYSLGFLYLQTNRQNDAKKIFNKILEINPNDEQISQILLSLGN